MSDIHKLLMDLSGWGTVIEKNEICANIMTLVDALRAELAQAQAACEIAEGLEQQARDALEDRENTIVYLDGQLEGLRQSLDEAETDLGLLKSRSVTLAALLKSNLANVRDILQYIQDDRIETAVEMLAAMIATWGGE